MLGKNFFGFWESLHDFRDGHFLIDFGGHHMILCICWDLF